MKVHDCKQGTDEWLRLRAGIPTASELDNLISPTGKIRTGQTPLTYLHRKVAERWLGYPMQSFSGGVMEQGSILESEAIPAVEIALGIDIERVGFIEVDEGGFGASPDGLVKGQECGIEIKCPQPPNHIAWLMGGKVPDEYIMQVQGCMFVTGFDRWLFASYCPGFPLFTLHVMRDTDIESTIWDVLFAFSEGMNEAISRLTKLNGGPRVRSTDDHLF